jgi:hypothetical protein
MYPSAVAVQEGWGGLLVAVLCEDVFRGWGAGWHAYPSNYSVGIHGCMLLGGGGFHYITSILP